MIQRTPRRSLFVTLLACALLATSPARADKKAACLSDADQGQSARDAGHLLEAREHFVACAKKGCPGLVQTDCADWLADVERRTPSIVVVARDGEGRDLADVEVLIDGKPTPSTSSGAAVSLDPGERKLELRQGGVVATQTIVLREGEKARPIEVRFGLQNKPPEATSRAPYYVAFGAVAALGAAGFIGFGVAARSARDGLASSCAPRCATSDVDAVRTKLVLANVGFGVGVAGLAALLITFITAPRASAATSSAAPRARSLAIVPMAGGVALGLERRF